MKPGPELGLVGIDIGDTSEVAVDRRNAIRKTIAVVAILAGVGILAAECGGDRPWDPSRYGQHNIVTNSGQQQENPMSKMPSTILVV